MPLQPDATLIDWHVETIPAVFSGADVVVLVVGGLVVDGGVVVVGAVVDTQLEMPAVPEHTRPGQHPENDVVLACPATWSPEHDPMMLEVWHVVVVVCGPG
jgi:predicted sugar kinase